MNVKIIKVTVDPHRKETAENIAIYSTSFLVLKVKAQNRGWVHAAEAVSLEGLREERAWGEGWDAVFGGEGIGLGVVVGEVFVVCRGRRGDGLRWRVAIGFLG